MDLVVKSKISPRSGSVALKQLKPIHKKGAQILSLTLAKTLGKLRKINDKKLKKICLPLPTCSFALDENLNNYD